MRNLFQEATKDLRSTPDIAKNSAAQVKYLFLLVEDLEKKNPLKHDMDEKEQAFLTDFRSLSFAEFATNWAQIPVYYSIISGISNF